MTDKDLKNILQLSEKEKLCLLGYLKSISIDSSEKNLLWAKRWAYIASRKRQIADTSEKYISSSSFTVNLSKWYNSEPVQCFLSEYGTEERKQTNESIDSLSKVELLRELTALFRKERDPKLKAELGMKVADLENYDKIEATVPKEQRHYYLPMKCSKCREILAATNCANCVHTFENKNPDLMK